MPAQDSCNEKEKDIKGILRGRVDGMGGNGRRGVRDWRSLIGPMGCARSFSPLYLAPRDGSLPPCQPAHGELDTGPQSLRVLLAHGVHNNIHLGSQCVGVSTQELVPGQLGRSVTELKPPYDAIEGSRGAGSKIQVRSKPYS